MWLNIGHQELWMQTNWLEKMNDLMIAEHAEKASIVFRFQRKRSIDPKLCILQL